MAVILILPLALLTGCGGPAPTDTPTTDLVTTPTATPVAVATVDPIDLPPIPVDLVFAPAGGIAVWPAAGGRLVRLYQPNESVPPLGPLGVVPDSTSGGWVVAERRRPGNSEVIALPVDSRAARATAVVPIAIAPRTAAATVLDWTTGPGPGRIAWLEQSPSGAVEVLSTELGVAERTDSPDDLGPSGTLPGPGPYEIWAGPEGPYSLWTDGIGLRVDRLPALPRLEGGQSAADVDASDLTQSPRARKLGSRSGTNRPEVLALRSRHGLALVSGVEVHSDVEDSSPNRAVTEDPRQSEPTATGTESRLTVVDLQAETFGRLPASFDNLPPGLADDVLVAGPHPVDLPPGQRDRLPPLLTVVLAHGDSALLAVRPSGMQPLSPVSWSGGDALSTPDLSVSSDLTDTARPPATRVTPGERIRATPGQGPGPQPPPTSEPITSWRTTHTIPRPRDDFVIEAVHIAPSRDNYWILTEPGPASGTRDRAAAEWQLWHLALPDNWTQLAELPTPGPGGWQALWSPDGQAVLLLDQATQGSAATYRSALVGVLDVDSEPPVLAGSLYEAAGLLAGSSYFTWAPD